jgi:alcohol dehydrogenase (cytochrome c)
MRWPSIRNNRWLASVVAALAIALIGIIAVHGLRWRIHLLGLFLIGGVPDISLGHLVRYMMPGQDQALEPLIASRNPYFVVRNYRTSSEDIAAGRELFHANGCASCHGPDARGGSAAPSLLSAELKHGHTDWAIYQTIQRGIAGTPMMAHPLADEDTWKILAYIRYMDGNAGAPRIEPGAAAARAVPVAAEEILAVQRPAEDWLTYSGSYSSWRHSALDQITPSNVNQLALRWIHQIRDVTGNVEGTPIVRDGVMFVTGSINNVVALDARTGKHFWTYRNASAPARPTGQYRSGYNRGVAILGDKVYYGSGVDLIALEAATGHEQWRASIAPDAERYFISSAPLVVKDLVITGVGTRQGGRGFLVALDAATGEERWRFLSIPEPGEAGNETWKGDSWREGGGPMWLTGSYDPEQDLLIWGVGNPKPDYDRLIREGDNLYTNSVVALRGSTGELVWHFQFTPSDDHDWDSAQIPILADVPGGSEKRVLWANRNGFYYVLDRRTGDFVTGTPFVKQTWAVGLDADGRPVKAPRPEANEAGSLQFPGNVGGINWWSPSFDPALGLVFLPVLEQGMVYFFDNASWPVAPGGTPFYTAVRALDAFTGELVWEHAHEPRLATNSTGGLMSTETGLLFGSDLSTFFALESATGKRLWEVEAGSRIMAAPVTYSVDGEQYVVVAAGGAFLSFALPGGARHMSE